MKILLFLFLSLGLFAENFVTYKVEKDFGDVAMNYIKALYISWKDDIPLLYQPFEHSEKLKLSFLHQTLKDDDAPLLITQEILEEELQDSAFKEYLNHYLAPIKDYPDPLFPENSLTVALHYPQQKPPSDAFYLTALREVSRRHKPLFIQLFTDDPNPAVIRDRLYHQLADYGITEDVHMTCRLSDNDPDPLEDFFLMTRFDCFIHESSNYCHAASLLSKQITLEFRLPPFFSNILPEGALKEYLASQLHINPVDEFHLLAALGSDLTLVVTHKFPFERERGKARWKRSGPNGEAIAKAMGESEDPYGKAAAPIGRELVGNDKDLTGAVKVTCGQDLKLKRENTKSWYED